MRGTAQSHYESTQVGQLNIISLQCNSQLLGDAIAREKQIKAGSRKAKNDLIRFLNPTWKDLFEEIKDIMNE